MHQLLHSKTTSVLLAALIFIGIALHDTKIDTMTKLAIALPAVIASYEGAQFLHLLHGDSHTHVERVSVRDTASKYTSLLPKLPTRKNEDRKYQMQKRVAKGTHPLDSYYAPVLG